MLKAFIAAWLSECYTFLKFFTRFISTHISIASISASKSLEQRSNHSEHLVPPQNTPALVPVVVLEPSVPFDVILFENWVCGLPHPIFFSTQYRSESFLDASFLYHLFAVKVHWWYVNGQRRPVSLIISLKNSVCTFGHCEILFDLCPGNSKWRNIEEGRICLMVSRHWVHIKTQLILIKKRFHLNRQIWMQNILINFVIATYIRN